MRTSSLPRRAVLGAVLSLSLIGAGVAAFAADPTAGCSIKDAAGDTAVPGGDGSPDQDLDLLVAGYSTNATSLLLSAKVAALTDSGPDLFPGDDFEFHFTVNKKVFLVGAQRLGDPTGLAGTQVTPYVSVDGTDVTPTSTKAAYDTKASIVEVSVATADLAKLAGVPMEGAVLSALDVVSYAYTGGPERKADEALPAATVTWTYGATSCGGAVPSPSGSSTASPSPSGSASPSPSSTPSSDTATATITISAPARIHTSDPEPVTVTFKDGSGKPQSGKRITAQVGAGKAVAGTTNSSGQVKLSPVVVDRSGTRVLVVRYAGDSTGTGKTEKRQNVTVLAEVSKIATRSTGSGATRTFTMTLTDDDTTRHPYAGARLTVGYSGRSVAVTTDRNGRATLSLRSGTHVDIRYAGKPGYVAAATARTTA